MPPRIAKRQRARMGWNLFDETLSTSSSNKGTSSTTQTLVDVKKDSDVFQDPVNYAPSKSVIQQDGAAENKIMSSILQQNKDIRQAMFFKTSKAFSNIKCGKDQNTSPSVPAANVLRETCDSAEQEASVTFQNVQMQYPKEAWYPIQFDDQTEVCETQSLFKNKNMLEEVKPKKSLNMHCNIDSLDKRILLNKRKKDVRQYENQRAQRVARTQKLKEAKELLINSFYNHPIESTNEANRKEAIDFTKSFFHIRDECLNYNHHQSTQRIESDTLNPLESGIQRSSFNYCVPKTEGDANNFSNSRESKRAPFFGEQSQVCVPYKKNKERMVTSDDELRFSAPKLFQENFQECANTYLKENTDKQRHIKKTSASSLDPRRHCGGNFNEITKKELNKPGPIPFSQLQSKKNEMCFKAKTNGIGYPKSLTAINQRGVIMNILKKSSYVSGTCSASFPFSEIIPSSSCTLSKENLESSISAIHPIEILDNELHSNYFNQTQLSSFSPKDVEISKKSYEVSDDTDSSKLLKTFKYPDYTQLSTTLSLSQHDSVQNKVEESQSTTAKHNNLVFSNLQSMADSYENLNKVKRTPSLSKTDHSNVLQNSKKIKMKLKQAVANDHSTQSQTNASTLAKSRVRPNETKTNMSQSCHEINQMCDYTRDLGSELDSSGWIEQDFGETCAAITRTNSNADILDDFNLNQVDLTIVESNVKNTTSKTHNLNINDSQSTSKTKVYSCNSDSVVADNFKNDEIKLKQQNPSKEMRKIKSLIRGLDYFINNTNSNATDLEAKNLDSVCDGPLHFSSQNLYESSSTYDNPLEKYLQHQTYSDLHGSAKDIQENLHNLAHDYLKRSESSSSRMTDTNKILSSLNSDFTTGSLDIHTEEMIETGLNNVKLQPYDFFEKTEPCDTNDSALKYKINASNFNQQCCQNIPAASSNKIIRDLQISNTSDNCFSPIFSESPDMLSRQNSRDYFEFDGNMEFQRDVPLYKPSSILVQEKSIDEVALSTEKLNADTNVHIPSEFSASSPDISVTEASVQESNQVSSESRDDVANAPTAKLFQNFNLSDLGNLVEEIDFLVKNDEYLQKLCNGNMET